jgi:hypothetical protein
MKASKSDKKHLVVVVGSGFSSALTSGKSPILGNRSMPTLNRLNETLLDYMEELCNDKVPIPFAPDLLEEAIAILRKNVARPDPEKYNFEEMLSLLAIGPTLSQTSHSPALRRLPGASPDILRCVLFCLAHFFTSNLSYNGETRANRNFWYKVNDSNRAMAMKEGIWQLVDEYGVTFVSFNYDGLIEAFLDWWIGREDQQDRGYRYFVELSHAVPLTMPEHVYSQRDTRDFSRIPMVPIVLKPHGSIHFFQLRRELQGLMTGPTVSALHPRLDIGFNSKTGQRDISDVQFWKFADPAPLIIPPLLNKDSYFGGSYFQAMLRLVVEAVQEAEYVLVLGFSLPSSDLHVCAAFEAIKWKGKKLGLVFRSDSLDATESHWRRSADDAMIAVLTNRGIGVDSVGSINEFWKSVQAFLN